MSESSSKLKQRQELKQRLVPVQMRYVKMLEMSDLEVEEEVLRELDDNPALEKVDDTEPVDTDRIADDYAGDDDIPAYRLYGRNRAADYQPYEPVAVAAADTLQESLMRQLSEGFLSDRQRIIASYFIGNIDNNGYLTRDIAMIGHDLGIKEGIEVTTEELREVHKAIRALEPAGVGAVDLRDCLSLQLRRMPAEPAVIVAREVVTHYFDLFSKRHFDKLCAAAGITAGQLREATEVITGLNPKPGSGIGDSSDSAVSGIIPDFTVEVDDSGEVSVAMVNSLPELQVEATFRIDDDDVVLADTSRGVSDARAFLRRKRDDAEAFIKSLRMRQDTLMRVMRAIVKLQRDFFTGDESEGSIRPMVLRDVAAMTGLDLSVISRATATKWVATRSGVYPLKMFFNESVGNGNGEDGDGDEAASMREVMSALRDIISAEDKRSPLSDEAITGRLKELGYDLARRTVAKYRERLGIPVARLRRGLL